MSIKTIPVAFCERKFQKSKKNELIKSIQNSTLKNSDIEFLIDIIDGYSLKELSEKYCIGIQGVSKRKRRIFSRLHNYFVSNPEVVNGGSDYKKSKAAIG